MKRFGHDSLAKVIARYGGCWSPDCWVPWGMSRSLKAVTGHTYGPLYEEFSQELNSVTQTSLQRCPNRHWESPIHAPDRTGKQVSIDRCLSMVGKRFCGWKVIPYKDQR